MKRHLWLGSVLGLAQGLGCGGGTIDVGGAPSDEESKPVTSLFAEAAGTSSATFFDAPYPSDTRLTERGTPEVSNWPLDERTKHLLATTVQGALERPGFPVIPVGYFRFDGAPPARDKTQLELRGLEGAFALVDVDPTSPERGQAFPVVGIRPEADNYTPEHLFAIAARPGIVLHPKRAYAFVVFRKLGTESESAVVLQPSATLSQLTRGEQPARADGEALQRSYAPLWETLSSKGVDLDSVVAATVFTTGDVVEQSAELGDAVLAKHSVTLQDFTYEEPEQELSSFCHYTTQLELPQFQQGKPIYNTLGLFELGEDGVPVVQRQESVNVSLSVPRTAMPDEGYPLVLYFHGSGGVAREFVDGADKNETGQLTTWPARVLGDQGMAVVGASLPISPDRVKNASSFDYLNVSNPGAMLGTFRQGMFEQRLMLSALPALRIPADELARCVGTSLPAGVTEAKFDLRRLAAQGQSMGGMYTNLIGATDPRIFAAVPTGAGGYWMYFFLETSTVGGNSLLKILMRTEHEFSFMSPLLHLIQTALEPVDPMVSMPRLARRPLPGHPVRPIYEPVGKDDSYFPTQVFDAMVLAYGHPRAGDEVWPSMREAQGLVGLDSVASYPVRQNLRSESGDEYTGVVVQYAATGDWDSHGIFRRLPEVRHQYACFHSTFQRTGVAVVPAPAPEGTPCE